MRRPIVAVLAALMIAAPSKAAADPTPLGRGSVLAAVQKLRPGQYLWTPEIAPQGPILVIVGLKRQRAVVYRNGVPIGVSTVSTGRTGYRTQTGVFTILEKDVDHRSNIYDDAPMPYMQRLTWSGVALHAGNLPGYPASHGCIRLPLAFAKKLYDVTKLGMTVVVTDAAALPRIAPEPLLGGSSAARTLSSGVVWEPENSPSGPVSVVISAADQRAIVLRNGRQIGSAPVVIGVAVPGVSAYSLASMDQKSARWMRLSLGGKENTQTDYRGRIDIDETFRRAVLDILRPGATVIITPDPLSASATGTQMDAIVESEEK